MMDIFPFPRITGDKPETQISELVDYLIQFKETLEFALTNISADNFSSDLATKLNGMEADIEKSNVDREEEITQISTKALTVSDVCISDIFKSAVADEIEKTEGLTWETISSLTCVITDSKTAVNKAFTFPVNNDELRKYSMLRYRIKEGSYLTIGTLPTKVNSSTPKTYQFISVGDVALCQYTTSTGSYTYNSNVTINFDVDYVAPRYVMQGGYYKADASGNLSVVDVWCIATGTNIDPLTISLTMPDVSDGAYSNRANIVIELEGRM